MEKQQYSGLHLMPISQLELNALHAQILENPEQAAAQVQKWSRELNKEVYNEPEATQVIDLVCKTYSESYHNILNMGTKGRYKSVRARRMLAVLLCNLTRIKRDTIQEICGYNHRGSLGTAIFKITNEIRYSAATRAEYTALQQALFTKEAKPQEASA